jgi:F0F1-type ATP synthase membrane subunit c/vacuolar-type H+-ATPase subunit K
MNMEEISAENESELEKRYRITTFIIAAQIATTVVLAFVGWIYAGNSESTINSKSLMPLWVAVLFISVGTFLVRRILFKWDRLKDITLLRGFSGLLATLQTNSIILGSLAEAIAVIGCIIAVLTSNVADMLRSIAVALIIFFINFPRKSVWERIAAKMQKV